MDYKELIFDLKFLSEYVHDELNELRTDDIMRKAATAIETLLAEREATEWISVEDSLPTETGVYLVNIHQESDELGEAGDFVITAWYQKNPLLFAPKEIGWTLLNEWYDFTPTMRNDISHWMPLPTPPDQEQKEEQ